MVYMLWLPQHFLGLWSNQLLLRGVLVDFVLFVVEVILLCAVLAILFFPSFPVFSCLNNNLDIADSFRMDIPQWKMLRVKISEKFSLKKWNQQNIFFALGWVCYKITTLLCSNNSDRVKVYTFRLKAGSITSFYQVCEVTDMDVGELLWLFYPTKAKEGFFSEIKGCN